MAKTQGPGVVLTGTTHWFRVPQKPLLSSNPSHPLSRLKNRALHTRAPLSLQPLTIIHPEKAEGLAGCSHMSTHAFIPLLPSIWWQTMEIFSHLLMHSLLPTQTETSCAHGVNLLLLLRVRVALGLPVSWNSPLISKDSSRSDPWLSHCPGAVA